MAIRYVTVNELTGKVVNVDQAASISQISEPPVLHRNIVEADWVPGSDPKIGDEWDGQSPTTFTPPPENTELSNMTRDELLALQRSSTAAIEAASIELMSR
jgi:hypothetical protein